MWIWYIFGPMNFFYLGNDLSLFSSPKIAWCSKGAQLYDILLLQIMVFDFFSLLPGQK